MAMPDDDHVCQSLLGDEGEVAAVVHGDPDMSPQARTALAALIVAARRRHAAMPAEERAEMERRQADSRRRIRERNARPR